MRCRLTEDKDCLKESAQGSVKCNGEFCGDVDDDDDRGGVNSTASHYDVNVCEIGIWKNGVVGMDFGFSYTGKDNTIGHIVDVRHSSSRCCHQETAPLPPPSPYCSVTVTRRPQTF